MTSLLQINKKILEEKEQEINFLELRIQELTNLTKKQKEKVTDGYLDFFPESSKELLKNLIKVYLEFTRAKKQNFSSIREQRKQFNKLYEEIEEKLNEEEMKKVEAILNDCEELTT